VTRGRTPGPAAPFWVEWLRGACRRAIFADRLVRTTYFGLTTTHLLLGAATTRTELPASTLAALVLFAACLHVHIFLMNDVIDLEIDATQTRRADHPLVRGLRADGGLSRRTALAIAWLAAALAVLLSACIGAGRSAWLALGAAFLLIGIYNVWGKRWPVPPVTDVIQGLGWWGLVLYGVFVAKPGASLAEIADRTLPLLAFSMGFTVLITGIHGGLRDLVNDVAHGRTNTAAFLGAEPAAIASATAGHVDPTAVRSCWRVVCFAYAVLALMFWPSIAFVGEPAHFGGAAAQQLAAAGMALLFAANCALLWWVVKPVEARRDAWMSAHSVVLLAPPVVLYLLSALPSPPLAWLVALSFVAPLGIQTRFMKRLLAFLERYDAPLRSDHPAATGPAVGAGE